MWGKETLSQVFPTFSSLVVFLSYMAMFVAQGMLVTTSRAGLTTYSYNTVTVVLLTETTKLLLSSMAYMRDYSFSSLVAGVIRYRWVLLLYMTPALLYSLYNNLAFLSLNYFDPTTYFMFMQTRLLITGGIYQVLFKKMLSWKQWSSLLLLTIGCIIHAAGTSSSSSSSSSSSAASFSSSTNLTITTEKLDMPTADQGLVKFGTGLFFVLIQVLCSVTAGVYNEYLIKGDGADIHIMIQNVFMYLDSIVCNVLLLLVKGDLLSAFTTSSLASLTQPLVLCIILNNSVLGIVTSLFLKKLNSIVKAFASAIELVLTAILSVPLLGIPLTLHTVTALLIISVAVVMYARNPLPPNSEDNNTKQEEKA